MFYDVHRLDALAGRVEMTVRQLHDCHINARQLLPTFELAIKGEEVLVLTYQICT